MVDIVNELKLYGIVLTVVDPVADAEEAKHEYNIELNSLEDIKDMDAIIIAVAHVSL